MLKKSIAICALLTSTLALPTRAQQGPAVPPPPAAATTGPTMEQTVAFLNGINNKQTSIVAQGPGSQTPCQMEFTRNWDSGGRTYTNHTLMDLAKTDPKSISVGLWDGFAKTGIRVYDVTVDDATYSETWTAGALPPSNPAPGPATAEVQGLVRAIQGTQIVIISEKDHLDYTFEVTKGTEIYVLETIEDHPHRNYINLSRIAIGDEILVTPGKSKNGIAQATGILQVYSAPDLGSSGSMGRGAHKMRVFQSDKQDTAERAAKALIHAMVLCHKPEAPSLF